MRRGERAAPPRPLLQESSVPIATTRPIGALFVLPILAALAVLVLSPAASAQTPFHVEESTIADVQAAITSGQTTCRAVVQAYLDRAKAYNGTCTALVTADGA